MLCCQKLKEHKAIRAVAFSSAVSFLFAIPSLRKISLFQYDPTSFKRYRTEANLNGLPLVANVHNPLGTLKDMLKSPLFLKLGVAHEEYTKLKMNSEIDFGACFGNPLQAATDALRRTGWEADLLITNPIIPKEPKKQQLSRSSIKDRAYTTKVKHAKHRMPDAYRIKFSSDLRVIEVFQKALNRSTTRPRNWSVKKSESLLKPNCLLRRSMSKNRKSLIWKTKNQKTTNLRTKILKCWKSFIRIRLPNQVENVADPEKTAIRLMFVWIVMRANWRKRRGSPMSQFL